MLCPPVKRKPIINIPAIIPTIMKQQILLLLLFWCVFCAPAQARTKNDDLDAAMQRYINCIVKKDKKTCDEERKDANSKLATKFLSISNSPDLVMDNGHYFGKDLSPQELEDLIDLLKTF